MYAGNNDGEQVVWVDGQEVLRKAGVQFRAQGGHAITQFVFYNFHGGATDPFRPSKTQHVMYVTWVRFPYLLARALCILVTTTPILLQT